ncbi:sce7726 family protein [Lentibacillus sp. N15]|uniref:sce7726 family protein n=1 Tax=Lentibacillus songyuanensis TaxID=3136161 RepID=UPI0031B9ED10
MGLYDKDIREILLREFLETSEFSDDRSTVIVNELDVCSGSAIMDMTLINGKIHGFEIKSEHDTLERLQTQSYYYNQVFDTVTLVCSSKHLDKAMALIPDWWGIYSVNGTSKNSYQMNIIKEPQSNKSIDIFHLCEMLWKPELITLLKISGTDKGIKSKTRRELAKIISETIETKIVTSFVKHALKNRKAWKARPLRQEYGEKQLSSPN